MPEREVAPHDCALVIAIPMSVAEFDDDARGGSDLLTSLAQRYRTKGIAWVRDQLYRPVLAVADRVLAAASRAGVTVVRRATLDDFHRALSTHHVVTLLAHCRVPALTAADILDMGAMIRLVEAAAAPTARHIRLSIGDRLPRLQRLLEQAPAEAPARMAAVLEELVSEWRLPSEDSPSFPIDRVMLEQCLGSALREGRMLEMHDGLKTTSEAARAVPLGFDGVIDLSACRSATIGQGIKRLREGFLVVINDGPATPGFRLDRYAEVVAELGRRAERFTDVMTTVTVRRAQGRKR